MGGLDKCATPGFGVVLSRETSECGSQSLLEPNSVAIFFRFIGCLVSLSFRTHAGFQRLLSPFRVYPTNRTDKGQNTQY